MQPLGSRVQVCSLGFFIFEPQLLHDFLKHCLKNFFFEPSREVSVGALFFIFPLFQVSFLFMLFFLLACLFIFCFLRFVTFGQAKGNAPYSRSRHRQTNQSFRVCKVHLATLKVATRVLGIYVFIWRSTYRNRKNQAAL